MITIRINKLSFEAALNQAILENRAEFIYRGVTFKTDHAECLITAMGVLQKESIGLSYSEKPVTHG